MNDSKNKLGVYILYTGGTIGSYGPVLKPLQKNAFIEAFKNCLEPTIVDQIPNITIDYDGFDHTLDSTNMQPSDWILMANKILHVYDAYEAFIILHGTDTMAFTASALSFLLPNISKPVIVTGSQLPLFYQKPTTDPDAPLDLTILYDTDALRNILGAIKFGTFGMPEVGLYFADHLYRGNRVVKSNASKFPAFTSPNFPAIGEYGIVPKVNDKLLLPIPKNKSQEEWISKTRETLEIIKKNINTTTTIPFLIFPASYNGSEKPFLVSLLENMVKSQPPVKGIVLESYGEGNVPSYQEMKDLLKDIHCSGIVIMDCTQVFQGEVNYNAYATGAWLKDAGVVSGYDMTAIAAITKLIILKALYPTEPSSFIEEKMVENLVGELTPYYQLSGYHNEFLAPGDTLQSINGKYQLANTTDGSLILYDISTSPPTAIWQKDFGQTGRLIMQADANLVFYNKNFEPLFSSDTAEIGINAYFKVENDASLSIYNLYKNTLIKKINAER